MTLDASKWARPFSKSVQKIVIDREVSLNEFECFLISFSQKSSEIAVSRWDTVVKVKAVADYIKCAGHSERYFDSNDTYQYLPPPS
jgi:hypothetical protein